MKIKIETKIEIKLTKDECLTLIQAKMVRLERVFNDDKQIIEISLSDKMHRDFQ